MFGAAKILSLFGGGGIKNKSEQAGDRCGQNFQSNQGFK